MKKLNVKELAVLRQCSPAPASLSDIAKRFRRAKSPAQANSWARNSVRRPVKLGLLRKSGRGTYALTTKGRDLIDGFIHIAKAAA